jgi:GNAT superfamily N-acetyltransferase
MADSDVQQVARDQRAATKITAAKETLLQPVIVEYTLDHPDWSVLIDHLTRTNMLHHATTSGEAKTDCAYLGLSISGALVGHIVIRKQPLCVPASPLCDNSEVHLSNSAGPLFETFVQTFAVEEAHQGRGYGRALQEAAVQKSRELGCYQMRSWSSVDRRENYALKISLGFAIQPALYPMPGGAPISGVYFVKRL